MSGEIRNYGRRVSLLPGDAPAPYLTLGIFDSQSPCHGFKNQRAPLRTDGENEELRCEAGAGWTGYRVPEKLGACIQTYKLGIGTPQTSWTLL